LKLRLKWISWENSYTYKDTVKLVKYRNGIDLDPDAFPIDDLKHMSFSTWRNVGFFQYESAGIKYMKG
jgi:DNA polymerase-3 subunit alpha